MHGSLLKIVAGSERLAPACRQVTGKLALAARHQRLHSTVFY
jgi:hypothetical protein